MIRKTVKNMDKNKKKWALAHVVTAVAPEVAAVDIVGVIGDDESRAFELMDELKAVAKDNKELVLRINSRGGDCAIGWTIYDCLMGLKSQGVKIRTEVYGMCASIATVIALAGDEVCMSASARWMVHQCWGGAYGSVSEVRKSLENMEAIWGQMCAVYAAKTGKSAEDIAAAHESDVYYSAEEAKAYGWVDSIMGEDTGAENLPVAALAPEGGLDVEGNPVMPPKAEPAPKKSLWAGVMAKLGLSAEAQEEEEEEAEQVEAKLAEVLEERDTLKGELEEVKEEAAGLTQQLKALAEENEKLAEQVDGRVAAQVAALGIDVNALPAVTDGMAKNVKALAAMTQTELLAYAGSSRAGFKAVEDFMNGGGK